MGLKGQLEDLPLLDILQIVAFAQKTGYLHVQSPFGRGTVVFKDGLVVCAYSWSTLGCLRQIGGGHYQGEPDAVVREQIEISLRELTWLREGSFHFQLTEDIATELEGVDISPFIMHRGINPQHLLLDLAKEIDEDLRDTSALLESAFREGPALAPNELAPGEAPPAGRGEQPAGEEPPSPVRAAVAVVLVDDEPLVLRVVGAELGSNGYRVLSASSPKEGAGLARRLAASGERVLVVADLGMPTSTGRSFRGGFELVRRLTRLGTSVPLLLMTEKLSDKGRLRASKLGINRIVFKPALSKLDRDQYEADLRSFARLLVGQLAEMAATEVSPGEGSRLSGGEPEESTLLLDFLASMSEQLINPRRPVDISRMVLRVATKYLERGILFLVKNESAAGLGGFGLAATERESMALARELVVKLNQAQPFAEVVRARSSQRLGPELDGLETSLYASIGRGRARECLMVPLLNNREVLAILYGDNGASGKSLGKLPGLELFMAQAGMHLENVFLHRKLRFFESKLATGESES